MILEKVGRAKDVIRRWLGSDLDFQAPPDVDAKFLLTLNKLLIGTLSVKNGIWEFEYSDEFKDSNLRPIIEFPDVDRSYSSNDLWQFFAMRIPSAERTEVVEILRREDIKEDDAVSLLKRFGRKTIANPFELTSAF